MNVECHVPLLDDPPPVEDESSDGERAVMKGYTGAHVAKPELFLRCSEMNSFV